VSLTLSPGTGTAVPRPEKQFREHVVYLYRESDAFLEALCDHIGPALAGGNAAIVVATQAHRDRLEQRLMTRAVSTHKAVQQGALHCARRFRSTVQNNARWDPGCRSLRFHNRRNYFRSPKLPEEQAFRDCHLR